MDRVAVFVDSSYLFMGGSILLTGVLRRREHLAINIKGVVSALEDVVRTVCDRPLLRIYWYDAARDGHPTSEQYKIADEPKIKIRIGELTMSGEQKGVDGLIVSDMVELSRNRAISDAILLAGDADLRIGVLQSQQLGAHVHVLGVKAKENNLSRKLSQEADSIYEWDTETIGKFLHYNPPSHITSSSKSPSVIPASLQSDIVEYVSSLSHNDIVTLKDGFSTSAVIPPEYDRSLLRLARNYHNRYDLSVAEREVIRGVFVDLIQTLDSVS